jgi:hypothetical protein
MGLKVEQGADGKFLLRLYDPCPTGPFNYDHPLDSIKKRLEKTSTGRWVNRCSLADSERAHHIMSYGPNRWLPRAMIDSIRYFTEY